MDYFLQQLVNGITLGAIYALIAIGYSLVYGILGMINFAHGEIYMIGAFTALMALVGLGAFTALPLPLLLLGTLIVTAVMTGLYGLALEKFAYRRLRRSFRLAPLISAIGASIFLQNYVQLTEGARVKPLAPLLTGHIVLWQRANGFALDLGHVQLLIIVTAVVLMALTTILIQKTTLGRAMRATAADRTMATLLGVPSDRTIAVTFVIGAILAAIAGMMAVLYYGVIDFYIGFLAGLKAFTAAVLGGIGSVPGAMLGGFLIGLIETLWSAYGSVEYKDVVAFSVLILILLLRPSGLLGRPEVEKV